MCKGELLEFITLGHEFENKTIFEVWCICGSNLKWHTNWPKLMQLRLKIILIPSSIAICERGFSKQNAIKSHLCTRLNLKTLDALMRVSLCGCNGLGYLKKNARPKNTYTRLMNFYFVLQNQDCILIIQNIVFSKILYNPKMRWHFKINGICQLTFVFFL